MLRECCSLMLLCSWYWRAGLSSSLSWRETDGGWSFFRVIFLRLNTLVIRSCQALTRQQLLWWAGLYTLWFNQWSKTRVHCEKKGDRRHDRICLKPAGVESRVFPWECLPTAWLNSLCHIQLLWSPVNINPFFFFFFKSYFHEGFRAVLLPKKHSRDINVCKRAHQPLTILKSSQMHEIHGYHHTDVLWCDLYCNSKRQS